MAGTCDYDLFGLRVRSHFVLPELHPAEGHAEPDVRIVAGPVPIPAGSGAGPHAFDGGLVLFLPGIGRYRVADGSAITIEPEDGVPERNVRLYLLGSAFGALLHQRGALPLHANAVEVAGRAVAFMGESGSGKSTLAAWFHDHGYRVIADDVCVIGFGDGDVPIAYPGLPRLRLWDSALTQSGRDASSYERSYVDDAEPLAKFDVPIDRSAVAQAPVPLAAIYQLQRGNGFAISDLKGIEAADLLFANTYRGGYVEMMNAQRFHWESATRLLRAVPVYSLVRRWNLAELDQQSRRLVKHVKRAVEQRSGP